MVQIRQGLDSIGFIVTVDRSEHLQLVSPLLFHPFYFTPSISPLLFVSREIVLQHLF